MTMAYGDPRWLQGPAYGRYARPARRSRTLAGVRRVAASRTTWQVAGAVVAYFVYFLVRGITEGNEAQAVDHAHALVAFEQRMGFFWEPSIQRHLVAHDWVTTLANWMYIWGHWPLIAAVAAWLVVKRPAAFTLTRNAFLISGAIGVGIFAVYPVAPPRLADIGVVDTITLHSHSYRVLQPPAFVNQYAAVPSLHFGWDLLIGIALVREARWLPVRAFGAVVPSLMAAAIVVTANHYIFDAVAGGAVALTGLALATALRRLGERAGREEAAPAEALRGRAAACGGRPDGRAGVLVARASRVKAITLQARNT
jgi:hypothetical protein